MTDPKIQNVSAQICQSMTSGKTAVQEQCQERAERALNDTGRTFCTAADNETDAKMVQCFQKETDSWVGTTNVTEPDGSGGRVTIASFSNDVLWKYMSFINRKVPRLPDINQVYEDVIGKFVEDRSVLYAYTDLAKMGLDGTALTVKENGTSKSVTDPQEQAVFMWARLQSVIKKNENPETKDEDKVTVKWSYEVDGEPVDTEVTLGRITGDMDYKEITDMSKAYIVYMQKEIIGLLTAGKERHDAAGETADAQGLQTKITALSNWDYKFPYTEAEMVEMLEPKLEEIRLAYYYMMQSKMPNEEGSDKQKQLTIDPKGTKYGEDEKDLAKSYVVTGGKPKSLRDMMDANAALHTLIRTTAKDGGVEVPAEPGEGRKVVSGELGAEIGSAGSLASNIFGDLNIAILEKNGWTLGARITALYLDPHAGYVHPEGPVSDADDISNPDPSLQILYMYLNASYTFKKSGIKLYGKAGTMDNRNRTTPWMAFDRLHHGNGEGGQIIGRDTGVRVGVDIPLGGSKGKNHIAVEASVGAHGNPMLAPKAYMFDEDKGKGQFVHTGLVKVYKPAPKDGFDHIVDAYNAKLGWVVTGDGIYHVNGILEGKFNVIPKSRILQIGAGVHLGYGDGSFDWGVGGITTINPLKWLEFHGLVAYGTSYQTLNMGTVDTPNGPQDLSINSGEKVLSFGLQGYVKPLHMFKGFETLKLGIVYEAIGGQKAEEHKASATDEFTHGVMGVVGYEF